MRAETQQKSNLYLGLRFFATAFCWYYLRTSGHTASLLSSVQVSLGAAIYPTLALFNHSCCPDFMRCNRGRGVVCVANRNIRKGKSGGGKERGTPVKMLPNTVARSWKAGIVDHLTA